jgi:hypothetical protein
MAHRHIHALMCSSSPPHFGWSKLWSPLSYQADKARIVVLKKFPQSLADVAIYEMSFPEDVEEVVSHLFLGEKLWSLKSVLFLIRLGDRSGGAVLQERVGASKPLPPAVAGSLHPLAYRSVADTQGLGYALLRPS